SVFKILSEESPEEAAKVIYNDEIDIVFDLAGHSEGGITLALMAYRPANIQIAGIGWPSVLNLSFVNYILSDDILTDTNTNDKLLNLPYALCFSPDAEILSTTKTPHNVSSPIKFGVFNNFMKITDEMLLLWKAILDALPGATLLLQDTAPYTARTKFMKERLENWGLASKTTVLSASPDYLQSISETDIILDTFPYTGGNMTATALSIGVPVVALKGNRYGARFSASILAAAGCEDFVATNKDEYVKTAVNLAKDEGYLKSLHLTLKDKVKKSLRFDELSYMK
ncbi:MAG: glycosyl transferase family 41, partial [Selenomonadaceae bacterium]|nr:glycosyl transferase family 41 [Selenomonadaceae bacterium]